METGGIIGIFFLLIAFISWLWEQDLIRFFLIPFLFILALRWIIIDVLDEEDERFKKINGFDWGIYLLKLIPYVLMGFSLVFLIN